MGGMKYLLLILLLAFSTPVYAQSSCAAAETVEKRLTEKYGERPVRRGLQNQNTLYEWWENSDGTSWTIVRRLANGNMCVMSSGSWVAIPLPPAETPDGDPT